jgi:demethylmenaquinone methyltransferase / 2-methoxy-6-polyprenyl-1,4-benzoquinol methylase
MAGAENIKPYHDSDAEKKQQVAEMFNNISKRYDLLNHLLSLNIDKGWRRKVVALVKSDQPKVVLDVATGTADLAIALAKGTGAEITGADISEGMLSVGREKIEKKGLSPKIVLELGDSENLPYPDNTFDAITVAFGVRNFQNLHNGLKDMARVLKPGGQLVVLEFSQPQRFPFKQIYWFYFKAVLPTVGKLISKDPRAYTYLPESVAAFPYGKRFEEELVKAGLQPKLMKPVTFGIASIYQARK